MPFVIPNYWHILLGHTLDVNAVIVRKEEKLEPLAALYHKDCFNSIETLLGSGNKAVHLLFDLVPTKVLEFDELDLPLTTFANFNKPPS